jgi:hypothetical protein
MEKSVQKIRELFKKYRNNEYVVEKLIYAICNKLPVEAVCWKKEQQRDKKNNAVQEFIYNFMNRHVQYYYIKNSDMFIAYDGSRYSVINEDELWYDILTKISDNEKILSEKQKIKDIIIQSIKNTKIDSGIPESKTIQYIINSLYPLLFKTKSEAKYFLCILGDNILKKSSGEKYILSKKGYTFFKHINDCYRDYFKNDDIIKYFLFNHLNEKQYDQYRILDMKNVVEDNGYWKYFINEHILDIVFVAMHYSNRYDNAEKYLISKIDDREKILFLKNKKDKDIMKLFLDYYFVDKLESSVTYSELYYMWKIFMKHENIPDLYAETRFLQKIKETIKELNIEGDEKHIVGKYSDCLHTVREFRDFWESHIKIDKYDEIEISEIFYLFKKKSEIKTTSEKELHDVIDHFYPYIKFVNNKKIRGYKCDLWDKKQSVYDALAKLNINQGSLQEFSPLTVYKKYCKLMKQEGDEKIVSKSYFMEYIY